MREANSYTYMERLDKLNLWTLEERRNRSKLGSEKKRKTEVCWTMWTFSISGAAGPELPVS